MRTAPSLALVACLLSGTGIASAHVTLTEPPQRGGEDSDNQKMNPCGGEPAGDRTVYEPGETIVVTWTETVPHGPGLFRISFDPDGDSFDSDDDGVGDYPAHPLAPDIKNGVEGDGSLVLLDVDDTTAQGQGAFQEWEAEVTLPNINCDSCTLQLIQMMGEDSKEPDSAPADPSAGLNHIYFRCADIAIEGDIDPGMGGAGGAPGAAGGMGLAGGGSAGMAGSVAAGGFTAGSAGSGVATAGTAGSGGSSGAIGVAGSTTTAPMAGAATTAPTAVQPGPMAATTSDSGCEVASGTGGAARRVGLVVFALLGLGWLRRRRS